MLIHREQRAPEGSAFARYAFHRALGNLHALRVDGKLVGRATLIAAIPGPQYRTVELTWDVEEFTEFAFTVDELDDFDAGDMFNPARALKILHEANIL